METVLRVAFIYVVITVLLRLMGKRELSQMSAQELVMLLLIPEIVAQALVREDFSLTNAIIALCTLLLLVFLTSLLSYRFKRANELIEGQPSVLVHNGTFMLKEMDAQRIAPGEILSEMHKVGIERIEQVRWAILETDGKISFIRIPPDEHRHPPEEKQIT